MTAFPLNKTGKNGTTTENWADSPSRKIQLLEVSIFLFLILSSLASSYSVMGQVKLRFVEVAISVIFSDMALLFLVLYLVWRNGESFLRIGWSLGEGWQEVAWGCFLLVPVMLGATGLEYILQRIGLPLPTRPSFLTTWGFEQTVLASVMVAVVAVAEETIFRGYLILRLQAITGNSGWAVFLATVFFTLGHLYQGIAGLVGVFFLGLVFAMIYLWRKSLLAPMILHFLWDFMSMVMQSR